VVLAGRVITVEAWLTPRAIAQHLWGREVTCDADRSQVRSGSLPQVMAAFRNTALGLIRQAGETTIAAACRRVAAQPWSA
jgi:hypothetical protein